MTLALALLFWTTILIQGSMIVGLSRYGTRWTWPEQIVTGSYTIWDLQTLQPKRRPLYGPDTENLITFWFTWLSIPLASLNGYLVHYLTHHLSVSSILKGLDLWL
jgi:hypothetical protein